MVLAFAAVLSGSTILRTILGIPVILFFPGYLTTTAIFPNHQGIPLLKRINLLPLTFLLLSYILIMSTLTWHRRKGLPQRYREQSRRKWPVELPKEILSKKFQFKDPQSKEYNFRNLLNWGLVVSLLLVVFAGVYAVATPVPPEKFTEFYLLGTDGYGADYPYQVTPGEETEVTVGIVNHEHARTKYRLELELDNNLIYTEGPISLTHGESWEKGIPFTTDMPENRTKAEFILYKVGKHGDVPYRTLFIWMDVKEF